MGRTRAKHPKLELAACNTLAIDSIVILKPQEPRVTTHRLVQLAQGTPRIRQITALPLALRRNA